MAIGTEEIQKLGRLAKTGFSESEILHLSSQIETIIGYFNRLRTLDLKSVEPSSHVIPITCPLRADRPNRTEGTAAKLLYFRHNLFLVPPAIE
jgi:aspartyl/glutamyl-tRNA(Asn/Gln) amidotransferase C subunit